MTPEFVGGNALTLLRSGVEYFPALEREIDAARHEVWIQTYIYAEDDTGHRITAALMRAARRGVVVRVMVDGYGAKDMPAHFGAALTGAGARLLVYRPDISPWTFRRQRLRRMHRKVAVIDARVAFVGGINIIDDMHTPRHIPPRYDYAVRVEGPLLAPIQTEAEKLWTRVAWSQLRRRMRLRRRRDPDVTPRGNQRAAFVIRDNLRHRSDIEDAYLAAIESAREEIVIANAYFLPGRRFRRALMDAAARGVRVVLLLQGRVEYVLLHYASRALYGSLLEAGVQIWEYHKSFMHAKVAVIDERWATVGSSNIDPMSLALAREANVVADDAKFARELRLSLHQAMEEGAEYLPQTHWRSQPWWKKLPMWIGYGIARALTGLVGYAGKL